MPVHQPSWREKFFFLFSGMVISTPFPILISSLIDSEFFSKTPAATVSIISAVILAPFLEEFAKAYPLFFRHGETEKSLINLGFLTGLGFGIVEFLIYVFLLHVPVGFRIAPLLFHGTNTAIVSYGISKNKSFLFYLLAVLFHALNNFSALFPNFWLYGTALATLASLGLAIYLYSKAQNRIINYWK